MEKEDIQEEERRKGDTGVVYGVENTPPPHLTVIFALQVRYSMHGGTVSKPLVLQRWTKICPTYIWSRTRTKLNATNVNIGTTLDR